MSIKKRTTTGPPGSYARLKYLTTLAFGFRDPEAYVVAKEVFEAVDSFLAGEVNYLDLNCELTQVAEDVVKHLKGQTVEVR